MPRIERTTTTPAMIDDGPRTTGAGVRDARASLLPPRPPECGGFAQEMARMILESAHAQRDSARTSEAAEERAACAAEDRVVAEMRDKAQAIRSAALAEGITMAVGAGASFYGGCAGKDGFKTLGSQTFEGAKVLGSYVSAAQTDMDAEIEASRATARRALRGADDAKRDLQDFADLAGKALAFARDAARSEADIAMAAIRRA